MVVIDSSCWMEYFVDSNSSRDYHAEIEEIGSVLVPTIVIYEVFKKVAQEAGLDKALRAVAHMRQGKVVNIDTSIALMAARLSLVHKIPMADSLILAAARKHGAVLFTHDAHFSGLEEVRYFQK